MGLFLVKSSDNVWLRIKISLECQVLEYCICIGNVMRLDTQHLVYAAGKAAEKTHVPMFWRVVWHKLKTVVILFNHCMLIV